MSEIKEGGRLVKVQQYRTGRNFIRVGDIVKVRATPGKRNGFKAVVRSIKLDEATDRVGEVEVFGGPSGRAMARTFPPDRIERLAQTRRGERMGRSVDLAGCRGVGNGEASRKREKRNGGGRLT